MNSTGIARRKRKTAYTAMLFLLPAFIGFVLFMLVPIIFSLVLSFTDYNLFSGLKEMDFIGFSNYIELFKDDYFIAALKNNILFTVVCVPVTILLALLLANALNKEIYARGFLRALIFMPYITSVTAISIIFSILYNSRFGPINEFLRWIGLSNPPEWLTTTQWVLPALMIVWIWQNVGYFVVIFLAGLQGISKTYYEAADLDGASAFAKFRHITVPLVSPTTFFLFITGAMNAFKIFGHVKMMTEGGPGNASMVMIYHIYRTGFEYFEMGYASSISWIFFILIFAVTIIQWIGQKKWVKYV